MKNKNEDPFYYNPLGEGKNEKFCNLKFCKIKRQFLSLDFFGDLPIVIAGACSILKVVMSVSISN